MTILSALIIFSMGWSLRATLGNKFCFRCATRKLMLAMARKLIQKKDSPWRLKSAILLVLVEPGIELVKILGWQRLKGMVKNVQR